jgi:hypothetical protein
LAGTLSLAVDAIRDGRTNRAIVLTATPSGARLNPLVSRAAGW